MIGYIVDAFAVFGAACAVLLLLSVAMEVYDRLYELRYRPLGRNGR